MALHGWGQPMSIYNIASELGIGATGLSLNDSRVRNLLGQPGGAINISNAYGKSNMSRLTIGRYDNSGRTYLGFQSGSPIANWGAWSGEPTPQGNLVSLFIQRWSAYDNKIILQTNNMMVTTMPVLFQIAGQSFTFNCRTNDLSGVAIPNTMSDLWLANVGGVCLVKCG